ncbi:hypothetical protein RDWZM_005296 [Blomia tropicalis]|uniref:Uncharacterized protein n=1 Tax=Blomia tropicalis TaxID=40697 RepID=A0A9Q0M5Q1_BLOTA|nr:hypothetical protein RDWZM_005296 [Blomia tropicalis]
MSSFNVQRLIANSVTICLVIIMFNIMLEQNTVTALPAGLQNRLFDIDSNADIMTPDDSGDLQRNSARLHRTLFLLDTSDLLKKARLFSDSKKDSLPKRTKRQTGMMIRVRKPTLTFHDDDAEQLNNVNIVQEMRTLNHA